MTVDIKKLPRDVVHALKQRRHTEFQIEALTPEQIFDEYCQWHGLLGWGETLRGVLDSARKAAT